MLSISYLLKVGMLGGLLNNNNKEKNNENHDSKT